MIVSCFNSYILKQNPECFDCFLIDLGQFGKLNTDKTMNFRLTKSKIKNDNLSRVWR